MSTETNDSTIYAEYFRYTKEYSSKYGENTIVLLLVGSFFEIYGIKNAETGEITESLISEISEICQLNISDKKTTAPNGYKIVMAGFRDYTLDKYLVKLTDAGYTVPVFIQEKTGKTITRKLDQIYSPGTHMSYDTDCSPKMTNNIMCIWIECFKPTANAIRETVVYGVAVINIFTGKSNIFQHETAFYMNTTTFDELERYVSIYEPCEVIFISGFEEKQVNTVIQFSGIRTQNIYHIDINDSKGVNGEKVKNCASQKYIKQILGSLFGEETYDICMEFQNRNMATQAFCYLLNYIKEHNPDLIRKIALPSFNNTSDRMILANHTLLQLNIIDDSNMDGKKVGKLSSVLGLLNKCCSPMGRRRFQNQLTNPTFNEEWLNKEYEMTELFIKTELVAPFRKQLVQIRDLEKLCRQLILRKIYPSSIYHLYFSIQKVFELNASLIDHPEICQYLGADINTTISKNEYIRSTCTKVLQFLNEHFIIDACKTTSSMNTFDEPIIQSGVSKKLDDTILEYKECQESFEKIHRYFNELIKKHEGTENNPNTEYVKIHETEKSGVSLQITSKRSQLLKTILEKRSGQVLEITPTIQIPIKEIKYPKASSTNVDIQFPELEKICNKLLHLKNNINNIIANVYLELLVKLENTYFNEIEQLAKIVSKMDVLQCKAYIAEEYNYCRPIIKCDIEKSFVDAKDIRHCLIEHIQQNEIYVTNDIVLGAPAAPTSQNGILLYGTNAVGKTSFIRAIGIAIIMAQAGIYVPCSHFEYKPYTAIFSRILGNDNIFKGLSTFAVEMSELRIILKMADEKSLILGDELCSGTEMESALSIFVSGLQRLHSKQSSFIFATHFHEIVDYEEIKELSGLAMKHMEVSYNRELDALVYDRKLRDGSGPRIYGLEVCKSLYMDEDFLENAYAIRNKYYPESRGDLSSKKTTYNANKIRGICEKCGDKMASETHHLVEQKLANSKGFIDTFHKNHPANLLSVCETCHNEIHYQGHEKKEVESPLKKQTSRKKTTKGYILE
jgi:DNA mismatch repair protein MutS